MRVYTCKNPKCQEYLIGGTALCKVISAEGEEVCLDSEDSSYKTSDEKTFLGEASCFHCKGVALKIEFAPDQINPDQLSRDIDELDGEIESVMKMLGVDE